MTYVEPNLFHAFKDKLVMKEDIVYNAYGTDFGEDDDSVYDHAEYLKSIKFERIRCSNDDLDLEFDLLNIDCSMANAIRRVLIAEVPTIAIEKVYIHQNTSIIQDEVLAHRLGLIPLRVDHRLFKWKEDRNGDPNAEDTIVMQLSVKCSHKKNVDKDATTSDQLYDKGNVYSSDIFWKPIGNQEEKVDGRPVKTVDDDILIAKMVPGQEIDLTCHCVKGIGQDHAKFSPVATASYRLLPEIALTREFEGEEADKLKECFSNDVISIKHMNDGRRVACVDDARRDIMCSRNIFRYPELADSVILSRDKKHFIFSVESTGALTAPTLVLESIRVLKEKLQAVKNAMSEFA